MMVEDEKMTHKELIADLAQAMFALNWVEAEPGWYEATLVDEGHHTEKYIVSGTEPGSWLARYVVCDGVHVEEFTCADMARGQQWALQHYHTRMAAHERAAFAVEMIVADVWGPDRAGDWWVHYSDPPGAAQPRVRVLSACKDSQWKKLVEQIKLLAVDP